jgi:hypothetical protein
MTDLQATLDAIETLAVQECGHCRQPLDLNGPSLDFCGDWCQTDWLRAKQEIVELVGYDEPSDLPQHAYNLTEMYSPEVTPEHPDDGMSPPLSYGGSLTFELRVDTSRFESAMERLQASVQRLWEPIPDSDRVLARLSSGWVSFQARQNGRSRRGLTAGPPIFDEIRDWQPTGLINQITVSDVAHVFDVPEGLLLAGNAEPFGADFDFEWRPATSLPHSPPPAVLPALPSRDWQALIDRGATGPDRREHAPRQLARRRR